MTGVFGQWDLVSYPGLLVAVVAVVEAAKRMWKPMVSGKEPKLCIVASYALGVASKLTVPHAFEGVYWLPFLLSLAFVAVAAGATHDWAMGVNGKSSNVSGGV